MQSESPAMRDSRVTHNAFERLERSAAKVARSVLRRGGYSNVVCVQPRLVYSAGVKPARGKVEPL